MSKHSLVVSLFVFILTTNLCLTKEFVNYVPGNAQAGTLRRTLENGRDPHIVEEEGLNSLYIAVKNNDTDEAKVLLENGINPNFQSKDGNTPLHLAAKQGNAQMTSLLIEYGADVEARAKNGFTALHQSAKEGKVNVARILLRKGAKFDSRDKDGETPLIIATKFKRFCMVKFLYEYGNDPTTLSNNLINCNDGKGNVLRYLLEKGEDPDAPDIHGFTALHLAVASNNIEDAKTLLEYGANPNAQSKNGLAPLHIAAATGNLEMVTLLLDHNADVNIRAKPPSMESGRTSTSKRTVAVKLHRDGIN